MGVIPSPFPGTTIGLPITGGTLTGTYQFTGGTGTVITVGTATVPASAAIGTALITAGGVDIKTAGQGLSIANGGAEQGTNCKVGTGSLSAGGGVGTVNNTTITANSYIFITDTSSSITNVGNLAVISQSAGVNFVVKSTNASDVSTFNYFIVEPG